MAEGAGVGLWIERSDTRYLFGEDQARYLLAVAPEALDALKVAAAQAEVPLAIVGQFGGLNVTLGADASPMADLSALYRGAFAAALGV